MRLMSTETRCHSFDPGFRVELHHKDLGIALAAGREYGVTLPVTANVDQMLGTLKVREEGIRTIPCSDVYGRVVGARDKELGSER